MAKRKNYTVQLKVEKETSGVQAAIHEFHAFMSVLMLINAPFRVYHMIMRDVHAVHQLAAVSAGSASAAISSEGGAATATAAGLSVMNQQLATAVLLMGALSEGAAIPGMMAGETAAATIVGAAVAGGAAVPVLQTGGLVTKTGAAVVERGETVVPAGAGGFGGTVNITNHISVDPAGMDLTDFTDKINDQMRLALRGHTRDVPI